MDKINKLIEDAEKVILDTKKEMDGNDYPISHLSERIRIWEMRVRSLKEAQDIMDSERTALIGDPKEIDKPLAMFKFPNEVEIGGYWNTTPSMYMNRPNGVITLRFPSENYDMIFNWIENSKRRRDKSEYAIQLSYRLVNKEDKGIMESCFPISWTHYDDGSVVVNISYDLCRNKKEGPQDEETKIIEVDGVSYIVEWNYTNKGDLCCTEQDPVAKLFTKETESNAISNNHAWKVIGEKDKVITKFYEKYSSMPLASIFGPHSTIHRYGYVVMTGKSLIGINPHRHFTEKEFEDKFLSNSYFREFFSIDPERIY